jgi:hypothetical protein
MPIKNGKDFWAGLMFIAFGAVFFFYAREYPMGTTLRMGPAYFPTVLGALLVVLGGAVLVRSFFSRIQHTWRLFRFRPVNFVAGVVIAALAYWNLAWVKQNEWLHLTVVGLAIVLLFSSFGQRSLWQVLAATLAFGYLLKPLGLVLASFLLVIGAGMISPESKWKEVLVLAVALALFAWMTFIWGLEQPFPVWPAFLQD